MSDVSSEILRIEQEVADAFNRGDTETILSYFDDRQVGFSSTRHERLHGLEAMRSTFAYYLEQSESMEFAIDQVEVHQFGEAAVSTFYWSIFLKTAKGEHEVTGRGSHVFVRRGGAWKIVHEHFSRAQHPPELWDTSPGE